MAGSCSIGFDGEDLDRAYAELQSKRVTFVVPPTSRPDEGTRLAVALDPDGLSLSFSQTFPR